VKPYLKRQKNDAADAEAICEAVTRANMRFVETKTPEQQSCLMLHRTCHLFIRQQTAVINVIRAHLAEFGIVAPVGRNGVELLGVVADPSDKRVPAVARACLAALGAQLRVLKAQILEFDRMIKSGTDPARGASGSMRFPASVRRWLLPWSPASRSEGFPIRAEFLSLDRAGAEATLERGKDKLGGISKQGDRYLPACSWLGRSP
jgi:transposase